MFSFIKVTLVTVFPPAIETEAEINIYVLCTWQYQELIYTLTERSDIFSNMIDDKTIASDERETYFQCW